MAVQNMINGLKEQLPNDIPLRSAQSFIVTAGIKLAISSTIHVALLGGTIAALATITEAVVRPILESVLHCDTHIRSLAQFALIFLSTRHIAQTLYHYEITSRILSALGFVFLNNAYSNSVEKNSAMLFFM